MNATLNKEAKTELAGLIRLHSEATRQAIGAVEARQQKIAVKVAEGLAEKVGRIEQLVSQGKYEPASVAFEIKQAIAELRHKSHLFQQAIAAGFADEAKTLGRWLRTHAADLAGLLRLEL